MVFVVQRCIVFCWIVYRVYACGPEKNNNNRTSYFIPLMKNDCRFQDGNIWRNGTMFARASTYWSYFSKVAVDLHVKISESLYYVVEQSC